METTEREALNIMRKCNRFETCSSPICPLDLLQDKRTRLEGEETCTAWKSIRRKAGEGTALKYKGLKKNEWEAKRRWDDKPEEEKEKIREQMRERFKKHTSR